MTLTTKLILTALMIALAIYFVPQIGADIKQTAFTAAKKIQEASANE